MGRGEIIINTPDLTAINHYLPRPVEIGFAGAVVRGQVSPCGPNWVVLVHEPGGDLDTWADLPAAIAADGYSVLAVDLPGHGLSDDPWVPGRIVELIHALAVYAASAGAGKVFVAGAGEIATAAMFVQNVNAVIALSPAPFAIPHPERTPPVLILTGGGHPAAAESANAFFRQTRGWAVISSFGTADQGIALLHGAWADHALEQALAFLRDYRIPPAE